MNRNFIICIILGFLVNILPSGALEYDYTSTKCVPIELYSETELSTKEGIIEGEKISLRISKDVYLDNRLILKKGTQAKADVETVITAGMNGFPAEIIINNFEIHGISSKKILSNYSKTGQNRCLWVYPLKWALTPLPPTGSLTNFIYGGHAKLKTTDKITIYYYPEWK